MIFECGEFMAEIYNECEATGTTDVYIKTPGDILLKSYFKKKGFTDFTVRHPNNKEVSENSLMIGKMVIEFSDPEMETMFLLNYNGKVAS